MKAKKLALLVAILLVMDLFPFLPGNQPLVHSARAAERSRIVPEIPTIRGGVAGRAKSANDTTYIFGGPGTLAGKFQNAFGQPDRQGWLGVDRTDQEFYWHRDTFHAADLDPTTPDTRLVVWYDLRALRRGRSACGLWQHVGAVLGLVRDGTRSQPSCHRAGDCPSES